MTRKSTIIQLSVEEPYETRFPQFFGSRVALVKGLTRYLEDNVYVRGITTRAFEDTEEYDRFIDSIFDKYNEVYAVSMDYEQDICLRWKLVEVTH